MNSFWSRSTCSLNRSSQSASDSNWQLPGTEQILHSHTINFQSSRGLKNLLWACKASTAITSSCHIKGDTCCMTLVWPSLACCPQTTACKNLSYTESNNWSACLSIIDSERLWLSKVSNRVFPTQLKMNLGSSAGKGFAYHWAIVLPHSLLHCACIEASSALLPWLCHQNTKIREVCVWARMVY